MHRCTISLHSWAYLIISFMNTFANYKNRAKATEEKHNKE